MISRKTRSYRLSCPQMTVCVDTQMIGGSEVVVKSPAITRKFVNSTLEKLEIWLMHISHGQLEKDLICERAPDLKKRHS